MEWTADGLAALYGIVVSLLWAYLPGLKTWFEKLDPKWKPIVNLGVLVIITAVRLAIVCKVDWSCMQSQLPQALSALLTAIVANQATYASAVRQFNKPESQFQG